MSIEREKIVYKERESPCVEREREKGRECREIETVCK